MNEQALRIAWMRAVLRLHARGDVAAWGDDEVCASFATLRERPIPFDAWCERMGFGSDDAESLVNVVRASAPNVSVKEETQ